MKSQYNIYLNDRAVGTVSVSKEGLYYVLDCRCRGLTKQLWRIGVITASAQRCLGVCVPEKEEFVIRTRLPIKCLGDAPFHFYIITDHNDDNWLPICTDKPVCKMTLWENARFERRNGKPGLRLG